MLSSIAPIRAERWDSSDTCNKRAGSPGVLTSCEQNVGPTPDLAAADRTHPTWSGDGAHRASERLGRGTVLRIQVFVSRVMRPATSLPGYVFESRTEKRNRSPTRSDANEMISQTFL